MSPTTKNYYTWFAGIAVGLAGLLAICGWIFNIPILVTAGASELSTMKFNTAVAFVFAGICTGILATHQRKLHATGKVLSLIIAAIGLITLAQHAFDIHAGIDQLLWKDTITDTANPGRMSQATCVCLLMIGIALFLQFSRRYHQVIQILAFLTLALAAIVCISYAFNLSYRSRMPFFNSMAVHSAISFIILAAAIFFMPAISNTTLPFEWKLIGSMGFIMLVILTSFYLFNKTNADFISSSREVEHTREVLFETEQVLSATKDIENATIGFVLTAQQNYLDQFQRGVDSIYTDITRLRALIRDNPAQQKRIDTFKTLVDAQLRLNQSAIFLKKNNETAAAQNMIVRGNGANSITNIRDVAERIKEAENKLLGTRQALNQRNISDTTRASIVFIVLAMTMLVVIYLLIQSNLKARSRAERELKESEEWFATTLSSIGDGVIVTDHNSRVVFMNPVARSLTKWGNEGYGKLIETVFEIVDEHTRKPIENPVRRVLREGQVVELSNHTKLIRADKSEIDIDDSAAPIIDDEGAITGVVLVFRDVTEKKKTEAAVRYNALLLENISDAVISVDDQYRIISMNRGAEELLNVDEDDVKGKKIDEEFDVELSEPRDVAEKKFLKAGKWVGEMTLKPRNRNRVNTFASATIIYDDQNKIIGVVNVLRDITERTRAEEQNRYNSILYQNISDAIVSTDKNFLIRSWNKAAEEMYGYTAEEMIGKTFRSVIKGEMTDAERNEVISKLNKSGYYKDEFIFVNKSGALVTVLSSSNVLRDAQGEIYGYVAVHRNITDRKKDQERIDYLANLVEQASDSIFSTDNENHIISWNKGAERMYGYSKEEVLGKKAIEITQTAYTPEEFSAIGREIEQNGRWQGDGRHKHRSGATIHVYTSITPIRNYKNKVVGFVLVVRDITARKKFEEQLRDFNRHLEEQVKEKTAEVKDIFNRVNDGFMAFDEEWRFTYLNKKAGEIFRIEPDTMLGKVVWEALPAAIGNPFYEAAHRAMQTQQYVFIENYSDIYQYWYESHLYPSPKGLSVYFRDVSEKKKAEELLISSEETRRLIVSSAMDAIVCADIQGNITVWNNQAQTIFGWTEEEAMGKNLASIIIPERYREQHRRGMQHYEQTGEGPVLNRMLELYALKKNGEEFPVEITIIPIHQKNNRFFCAFIRDITERKKTQTAILKEKDLSEKIIDSLPGIFYFYDHTGKFIRWNKRFETISGYSAAEIARMHPTHFFPEEEKEYISSRIGDVFQKGTAEAEAHFLSKDGRRTPFYFTGSYIEYEGQPCLLGTGIDITERKRTETAILREKNLSQKIIGSLPGIFYFFDHTGKFLQWNKQLEITSGYSTEEISRMHPSEFFAPEFRNDIEKNMNEVFRHGDRYAEGYLVAKDRRKIPFYFTGSMIEFEGQNCIVGTGIDITEKKKAEKKLKEERLLLRTLIDNLPDYIYVKNREFKHVINNRANVELLGAENEAETLGKTASDYFGEKAAEGFLDADRRVFESGEPVMNTEELIINKDGEQRWLLTTKVPLLDKDRKAHMLVGISRDITDRKQAQKELEQSNERFEMIARTTNDAIWEWDFTSNQVWANDMHQALYGLSKEDPIPDHQEWRNRLHPDERDRVVSDLEKALASDKNVWIAEYQFRNGGEEYKSIYDRTYIVRDRDGQPLRMMGSMADISARKKAEETLRQNEEKYRLLFSNSPLPMWVYDLESFRFLDVNEAAISHYGYTRAEFLQMNIADIRPKEDVERMISSSRNPHSGVRSAGYWRHFKKDGTLMDVEVHSHDIIYNNKKARLVLANDVTDKNLAQQRIRETTEELRMLSARLQEIREEERMHMAHEIHDELGQRLTVLKMDISWLGRKMKTDEEEIREKIKNTLALLDGTIKIVRKIATELRPGILDDLGLIPALEWQSKEFEDRSGIRVSFQSNISEIALNIQVATGLFRIFQESLTNVGRHAQATDVQASLAVENEILVMTISDNGVGFDKTRQEGVKTLGIIGMKERTKGINGEYTIESEPGKGTTVKVTIPLNQLV